MSKTKIEDIYNEEKLIEGLAVFLSWTFFLPLRFLAYLANRRTSPSRVDREEVL